MSTITLPNGHPLEYVEVGEGAIPLLLVHGYPLDQSMWKPQLEGLEGVQCIVPDLRGFGASCDSPSPTTLTEHADDLAALLDALGIQRAVIAGLSMGGYIAFEFVRRHRERLLGVILLDTSPRPDDEAARAARTTTIDRVRSEGVGPIALALGGKLFAADVTPKLRDTVVSQMALTPRETIVAAVTAMRDRADSRDLLPTLANTPTLVIVGSEDRLTPPDVARAMASAIPGAVLVEVKGAGHLPTLERPAETTAAMQQFLDRLPAGR
ncbi:MAG: alpha/beta fold hydrolase [Gemmatimonadetes bacterium]|nr:alpha/beta fold hydrolase [Gemmatimonadota bacterium]MBL0178733.1 alpha/beta fold hydrolase [Gemmatimonadota bacterium]